MLLLMNVESFLKVHDIEFNETEDINSLTLFDLIVMCDNEIPIWTQVLNFFIYEDVEYNKENQVFIVTDKLEENDKKNVVGIIHRDNFQFVVDIICQKNYVQSNKDEDISSIKSSKARAIMEKILKGRKQKNQNAKSNPDMELSNIISAVANKHPSLNMTNIWNLTVYQLWDSFNRTISNNIYTIRSMSVAAYGDKNNSFDINEWYKRLNNDN